MTSPPSQVLDFHVRLTPSDGALDRLVSTMDDCGVDRAVVCAGGVIDLDTLSRQLVDGGYVTSDADNDAVLAACEKVGERLVPFYFANPHRPAPRYAKQSDRWRGLEISPAVHGVPLTDPRVRVLVKEAADAGHPVYVVCLDRPGCTVPDLVRLADMFPETVFVLGHAGIGNIDFHALNLVASPHNIVVETSGGYTSVARAALDRLGAERVVFGTEYPLQHPSVELAKFAALDLDPDRWRQVAWRTAHRLLGEDVP